MPKPPEPDFVVGSGNVYADLGFDDAEERLARSQLAMFAVDRIKQRRLTQVEAARVLGIDQPKVSRLLNGKLTGFSCEQLMRYLNALDFDVEITVTPRPKDRPAEVRVRAAS